MLNPEDYKAREFSITYDKGTTDVRAAWLAPIAESIGGYHLVIKKNGVVIGEQDPSASSTIALISSPAVGHTYQAELTTKRSDGTLFAEATVIDNWTYDFTAVPTPRQPSSKECHEPTVRRSEPLFHPARDPDGNRLPSTEHEHAITAELWVGVAYFYKNKFGIDVPYTDEARICIYGRIKIESDPGATGLSCSARSTTPKSAYLHRT